MYTFKINVPLFSWLFLLSSLTICLSAVALPSIHYTQEPDSVKAYWKLHTDYASRGTIVRFYDPQHRIIYEETMPGKYVKLKKRNIRLFNSMLHRLTTNQLLVGEVKTHELIAGDNRVAYSTFIDNPAPFTANVPTVNTATSLVVQPYLTTNGKVKLVFLNPKQEKVYISLNDEAGRSMYKESSTLPSYHRAFNLTDLKNGDVIVKVEGQQKTHKYKVTVDNEIKAYRLQALK